MSVGQVAERAGVNVETLRYYERRGLLPAPEREPSGRRRYDEDTVRLLRAIKEAQAVGFTLAEIAEYLRAARRSAAPSEALRIRMAAKIDEIDARIAGLRRTRDELARVVGCACESLDHCTCGAAYLARQGRNARRRPTLLHVTNGESAGNTLRQTTLGGAVLPWQDALHADRCRRSSAASCSVYAPTSSPAAVGESMPRSVRRSNDAIPQYLDALREGAEVVLWFEHDLYDQLQLLDALALAGAAGTAPSLIVVDTFPGRPGFSGLGELSAEELETLWPGRQPADAVVAEAAAAWEAFRAPEPTALAELARRSTTLPFLAAALARVLEELPSPRDGLSATERRVLEAIAAGADTPTAAFLAVQRLEAAPFLGDTWFYAILATLGRGPNRLVETAEGAALPPPPPLGDPQVFMQAQLRLTDDGERVLRGERDRVELLGIDRWLGGTRLDDANVWRWDAEAQALAAPPA